jgi:hypothetical protein
VPSLAESSASLGNELGKYFSITSLLPALLFVTWLLVLVGLGAPGSPPDPSALATMFADWSPAKITFLLAGSVILGLAAHPLMFATTQVLEGYWGSTGLGVRLAHLRAEGHRMRVGALEVTRQQHADTIEKFVEHQLLTDEDAPWTQEEVEDVQSNPIAYNNAVMTKLSDDGGRAVFAAYIAREAASKARSRYPDLGHRVMPTRLGNVLRRAEDRIGQQYSLDAITIAPHVAVVAESERAVYLRDSRQEMDLAVRLCSFAMLATVLSTIWLATAGWWVLLSAVPYTIGYISYRGAVGAAEEWATALAVCIDIDRFRLYEALHVPPPLSTRAERDTNRDLIDLLRGSPSSDLTYRAEGSSPGS